MHNHEAENLRRDLDELKKRVEEHHSHLIGDPGEYGVVHKVNILWRALVWGVCGLWGGIGVWVSKLLSKLNP